MNIDRDKEQFDIDAITGRYKLLLVNLGIDGERLSQFPGAATILASCQEFSRFRSLQLPLPILSDPAGVFRRLIYHVTGAMDLVRYSSLVQKSLFAEIKGHFELALLAGFGVAPTYFHLQGHPDPVFEMATRFGTRETVPTAEILQDATRKGMELMFGLAAQGAFGNVLLENPNNSSKGAPNPDFIVASEGKKFGVACKMVSSRNVSNFRERIEDGIKQINRAVEAGTVDHRCGIVVIDISALINHETIFVPQDGHLWEESKKNEILNAEIESILAEVFGVSEKTKFSSLMGDVFRDSHAAPCVMIYGHTVMMTDREPCGAFCYVKNLRLIYSNDHSAVDTFANRLSDAIHGQIRQV